MTAPFYQDESVTILHADHRDVLPLHDVAFFLTSPPYDSMRTYGGHQFDFEACALGIRQSLAPGGVLTWVVADESVDGDESGTSFKQALHFKRLGLKLWDTMIYEKNGASYPSKRRYYQTFEYMFVFSNGQVRTANLLKDRTNRWYGQKWSNQRTRRLRGGDLQRVTWTGNQGGPLGVRFNVWRYVTGYGYTSNEPIAHQHPAPLPYQLAVDHILTWTNAGDLVVDPMCGSGTTLRAAKDLGRRAIGIDVNLDYCRIAADRMAMPANAPDVPERCSMAIDIAEELGQPPSLDDAVTAYERALIEAAIRQALGEGKSHQRVVELLGLKSHQALSWILDGRHKELRDLLPKTSRRRRSGSR